MGNLSEEKFRDVAQPGTSTLGFGQKAVATGTATRIVAAGTTYKGGIYLYPDPSVDVALATTAITSTSDATAGLLRAGGPPVHVKGPIDPSVIYALGASGGAVIWWIGQ